jgi:hypothetical protein
MFWAILILLVGGLFSLFGWPAIVVLAILAGLFLKG